MMMEMDHKVREVIVIKNLDLLLKKEIAPVIVMILLLKMLEMLKKIYLV